MKKRINFYIFLSIIASLSICLNNSTYRVNAGANEMSAPTIQYDAEYSESYYNDIKGLSGDNLLEGLALLSQEKHKTYTSYDAVRGGCAYSDEDPSDPTKVIGIYTGWSIDNTWNSGSNWNREHVWPQSLSNGLFGTSGAGSDIHHIRPEYPSVNGGRGNNPFADIDSTTTYVSNGKDTGCYLSGGYFEPRDESKGDVARILMYLYMHYSTEVSANSNFSKAGNLVITDVVYTSSKSNQASWNLLMNWNKLDPVDSYESNRNNYCASVTGVRNPFIDHSEFAEIIWNSSYSGNGALNDSSSTPGENYLKLATNTLSLKEGNTYQLKPSTNINNPSYTYESSNTNVATISTSGLIAALNKGETIITVYCDNLSASLKLTVSENTSLVTGNGVKYTVSSKTAVKEDNAPESTSSTYIQTYNTASQITSGNSATLTLSGYDGLTITGFTLSMKSNKSTGGGSLTVTCGNKEVYSISNSKFNTSSWYGAWSTSYVDIVRDDVVDDFIVGEDEDIKFVLEATENSLYIQSYTIYYKSDKINETLSLEKSSLNLEVDETYQLRPITNIENPLFTYESSNKEVASVSSAGLIKALNNGTTTITVYCNNLSASLVVSVVDKIGDIKNQVKNLETMAQLEFGYTYSKEGSVNEALLAPNVTTSTYMNDTTGTTNYASLVGLDEKVFNVTGTKGKPGNYTYIHTEGTIRVYADKNTGEGNTLTVSLIDSTQKINSIIITETKGATLTITDSKGNIIECNSSNEYIINDYQFNIQNTQYDTNASSNINAYITSISINYGIENIKYKYFENVNIKYSAVVPNELIEHIDSYGINITIGNETQDYPITNLSSGEYESTFALKLTNIIDLKNEIRATAYVYINGERLELKSKTYSVYSMIETYLLKANELELTSEQVEALRAFKIYIDNL